MTASDTPVASESIQAHVQWLSRPDGESMAYCLRQGAGPHQASIGPAPVGFVWLPGFHSDMDGTKALALDAWAGEQGRAFLRFDYFGHGRSSGAFADGTIGRWKDDTLAVLDAVAPGPMVLIGSSMGGWMALMAALARPDLVRGLILIAPAPDFTEDLMWESFPAEVKATLREKGQWLRPSAYEGDPYPITMALIEEARSHLLLRHSIPLTCPVRIIHGMADADVPWQRSLTLAERLDSTDVVTTFIKDGDHRLSDPVNIDRLIRAASDLAADLERT